MYMKRVAWGVLVTIIIAVVIAVAIAVPLKMKRAKKRKSMQPSVLQGTHTPMAATTSLSPAPAFHKVQYVELPDSVQLTGLEGGMLDDIPVTLNDANIQQAQHACAKDPTCFAVSHNNFGFARQYKSGGAIDEYLKALSDKPVMKLINPQTGKGFPDINPTRFWLKN